MTMVHIVCITGGLTGLFNASLALIEQLLQAGHEVTYASPTDFSEALSAEGIPFVQMEEWVIQPGDPPMGRWEKWQKLRSRQEAAVDGLGVNGFVEQMRSLSADLLLIDIEMHPHIMAAAQAGFVVGLLCPFLSVWHRPCLPPIHTGIVPGVGWRGSYWGIELSWLQYGWRQWQEGQRERWRRTGLDRVSVLRCHAERIGYRFRRRSGWAQWLVPYPHGNLPILCLNASELDFPHVPHPTMYYVGPMVQTYRQQRVSEQACNEITDLLEKHSSGRSLIYCSCSTFVQGDTRFLQKVIAAVAAQPQWDLVLGLGGQISPQILGALPPNVYAFAWAPQMLLLQYADCAIHNGGINSLNECICCGVPMLIYSLKRYDQDGNAARAVHYGLGIAGDFEQDGIVQISQHLQRLLTDDGYRQRVKTFGDSTRLYAQENRAVIAVETIIKQHQPTVFNGGEREALPYVVS